MRRLIAALALVEACASTGMPPGGPVDIAAPQIIGVAPDSGRVGVTPKEVIFRFDEVVSERPAAATDLADLFLISPRDGTPRVSWHRDEIAVRPRGDWRPNTTYTIVMLKGIADLRGNIRNTGASTFFSTGSAIQTTRISGQAFDWLSGSPASGALVEALVLPDTIHSYIALVDSTGAFALERMPPGNYTLRAFLDNNKNHSIDPSEPWDSSAITLADSLRTQLLLFVHDTIAPRIRDVSSVDSVSLRVTFDKPVDPSQTLSAANFAVLGPDSVPVAIVRAGAATRDSTTAPPAGRPGPPPGAPPTAARAAPAARDTTAPPAAAMRRPRPVTDAVITLQRPLAPKTTYRIRAIGIRGLLGKTGDSERGFTTPAPAPPPPATERPAGQTPARGDSVRPAVPPPGRK